MERVLAALRSPLGRVGLALLGLGLVALVLRSAGADQVLVAVERGSHVLPFVFVFEGGIIASELAALRLLYGPDRHKLTPAALARAGLVGYSIGPLVPAGRAVAEAVRATLLAPFTDSARAAAAGTRLQGIAMVANAVISLPCAIVALASGAGLVLAGLVAGNAVATFTLGMALLLAGRRSHMGAWLAKKTKRANESGPRFDELMREGPVVPFGPLAFVVLGRCFQVAQYTALVFAVGGAFGLGWGFLAEGIQLVGAAFGDLIPSQLGATEASLSFGASALGLSQSASIAMPLLARCSVLTWVAIGLLTPIVWRAPQPRPQQA